MIDIDFALFVLDDDTDLAAADRELPFLAVGAPLCSRVDLKKTDDRETDTRLGNCLRLSRLLPIAHKDGPRARRDGKSCGK